MLKIEDMTLSQVAALTNADQELHSIVSDIDEAIGMGLQQENKIKVDKIQEHLIAAHALIHDLDYTES